jgi:L-fuconolactonase
MKRVDAHHHLWDLSVRPQPWMVGDALAPIARTFTAADYAEAADASDIDASVVVQTVSDEAETVELLALCSQFTRPSAVVGWVDLRADSVGERLDALRKGPGGGFLRGIRHQVHDEADPEWITRDDVRRGIRAVGERGLVYDLLLRPHHLAAATATAERLDDVLFVLDHAAKPAIGRGEWEPWASDLRTFARLPNTRVKLSGLLTESDWQAWSVDQLRPYVHEILDAFGPDRVMLGSDWPVCTLVVSHHDALAAHESALPELTPAERHAVRAATAVAVYQLAGPPSTDRTDSTTRGAL